MILQIIYLTLFSIFFLKFLNFLNKNFLINILINTTLIFLIIIFILNNNILLYISYCIFINIFFAFLFSGLSHSVSVLILKEIDENGGTDYNLIYNKIIIPSYNTRIKGLIDKKILQKNGKYSLTKKNIWKVKIIKKIRKTLNIYVYG